MVRVTITEAGIEMDSLPGAAVYSADGEQFAYVRSVHGGYFELDVPWAQDFWLSKVYIDRVEENRVYLTLTKDETKEHRLRAPGIEPDEAPDRAATYDKAIDDIEALRLRERMEREMFGDD